MRGSNRRVRWIFLVCVLACPLSAYAQSVVDLYRLQMLRQRAHQILTASGGRLPTLPPRPLPAPLDSIAARRMATPDTSSETVPTFTISRWQRIPKLGQRWFLREFGGRSWSFLGNGQISAIDTMMTRDVRARLEAHFGKPTRALGDLDARERVSSGDVFEFEYWFVINDTIPLVLTDVNGPFERGIVSSTTVEHAEVLSVLRDTFLAVVLQSDRRSPYVDYYYDDELMEWYRTGFDGTDFFVETITNPGLNRPVITPADSAQQE